MSDIAEELYKLYQQTGADFIAQLKAYFEANREAREVMIMKGNKILSVSRRFVEGKDYVKMFMKRYLR